MNALKQSINRAKQTVDEQFGSAEKTILDPDLQTSLNRVDEIKLYTEKIIGAVEAFVQPDPTQRLLTNMVQEGQSKPEAVGNEMSHLASKLGTSNPYGKTMQNASETFQTISRNEKAYMTAVQDKYTAQVKRFLNEDMRSMDNERKTLETNRLDMDLLKPKATKGGTGSTAEQDYKKAVEKYQEQVAKVRGLVKNIETRLNDLENYFREFVDASVEVNKAQMNSFNELRKKM